MARLKTETLVTQSLLDRLTDHEEWPTTRSGSLRMFRVGIKRDVEWLLNARKPHLHVDEYPVARCSVLSYGLPDFAQHGNAWKDTERLLSAIVQTLRAHEPRILEPRVSLTQTDSLARSFRFHVEGKLRLESSDEEIKFDTLLETATGEYEVR